MNLVAKTDLDHLLFHPIQFTVRCLIWNVVKQLSVSTACHFSFDTVSLLVLFKKTRGSSVTVIFLSQQI